MFECAMLKHLIFNVFNIVLNVFIVKKECFLNIEKKIVKHLIFNVFNI
jgi:hypothetical protein